MRFAHGQHCVSRDADALRLTLDLLEEQTTGEKKLFMLSDGFGSTGLGESFFPFGSPTTQRTTQLTALVHACGLTYGTDGA